MRARPIRYVADGERDAMMLPPLVTTVIGQHRNGGFTPWLGIKLQGTFNGSKPGYKRKLGFVIVDATRAGCDVVAVVDQDRSGGRLDELRAARAGVPIGCAVGEAVPHGEAWLVDDLEPLRDVLGLDPGAPRPDLKNPKAAFDALIDAAGRDRLDAFRDVAELVDPARCTRSRDTGFAAFVTDLREQLGARPPRT